MNEFNTKAALSMLRELRRALTHVSDPHRRGELATQAKALAQRLGAKVTLHKERVRDEFRDDHRRFTGAEPGGDGRPYRIGNEVSALTIGAWAVLLVEVAFAAALGALTFALPTGVAVAIGVVLTLVLAHTIRGVIALQRTRMAHMPRLMLEMLQRWMLPLFLLWLAAIMTFLTLARPGMEDVPYGALAFNVCLTTLTLVSPALAAVMLAAADHRGWPDAYLRRYGQLELVEEEIELMLALCDH